jgi:predicted alpha-1,2-mannosidase
MAYYQERGYVPEGITGGGIHKDGASMTLEYAYQDWCLAQIAERLGKQEDYVFFMDRSRNYRRVWNPATEWMHPREMDGSWMADFSPVMESGSSLSARGFCEANSAIYSHYVPHDMPGLMELFGGPEAYVARLEEQFLRQSENWQQADDKNHAVNWVDYANQPSTQLAHLFNLAGRPDLSQKWVRTVKDRYADTTPYGGYHGDEDQGQMGALGVLMAIGLFSVDGSAAAKPTYEITTPVFREVTINLHPDYYPGKTFTIRVEGDPEREMYIRSARLGGQLLEGLVLPFTGVSAGGELEIRVGDVPR